MTGSDPLWQITLRLEPLTPLGLSTSEQTLTVTGRGYVKPGDFSDRSPEWTLRWIDDLGGARALLTLMLGGRWSEKQLAPPVPNDVEEEVDAALGRLSHGYGVEPVIAAALRWATAEEGHR